jgi:hypothetical protein
MIYVPNSAYGLNKGLLMHFLEYIVEEWSERYSRKNRSLRMNNTAETRPEFLYTKISVVPRKYFSSNFYKHLGMDSSYKTLNLRLLLPRRAPDGWVPIVLIKSLQPPFSLAIQSEKAPREQSIASSRSDFTTTDSIYRISVMKRSLSVPYFSC